jgi:hypothetical protein
LPFSTAVLPTVLPACICYCLPAYHGYGLFESSPPPCLHLLLPAFANSRRHQHEGQVAPCQPGPLKQ